MKKTILFLIAILLIQGVLAWFNVKYVMTEEYFATMFGVSADDSAVEQMVEVSRNPVFQIIQVVFSTVAVFVSILFNALVVFVGYYLFAKQSFLDVFKAVVVATWVAVIKTVTMVVNFIFINPPTSTIETNVVPFSLASFFDINKLDQWMVTPLSAVNIFEVLYILVLSYVLSKNLKQSFGTSSKVVLCSYGLVTLLYIVGLTLFSVYATK